MRAIPTADYYKNALFSEYNGTILGEASGILLKAYSTELLNLATHWN
jgi:hypothetical protein